MYRPRVLINVFLVNSTEDLILAVKKYTNSCWELVGEKLKFGEQFDECVKRVLKEETSIIINDNSRIKFICSFNAVDNKRQKHFIVVDYYIKLTEEEKNKVDFDPFRFQYWKWLTFEEILKMKDYLFFGVQMFIKNYKIKKLADIKLINAN